MLDAIRQQIAIEAPQKLSSVPPPNPSAPEAAVFGHMMQTPTEPDRVEPTAPKHDEDRGDLGVGWDTSDPMDVDRYDDPALAAAAEPAETVETAPAEPQAYGEQASVAQANAEASEAAMSASQVASEQAARSAAVIEQLQTGASAGPPVNAAAQLVTASAAELAANLAQMAPGDTEARQMQAALDATQPQDRSGVEAKGELLGELAGLQEAESADKAGPAQTDEQTFKQVREATRVSGSSDLTTQMAQVLADSPEVSASQRRTGQAPAESPDTTTPTGPVVSPVDLTGAGLAGGGSSGSESLAGDRVAARVSMDPAGAAPAGDAAAAQGEDLPGPNIDQLAARTLRWQHLGILGNGGSARIRLDPPSLGSVEVMLRTDGNSVRVELTVESESVRQLLSSNSNRLAQSLQSLGLQAGRIEVTVETPGESMADAQDDGQADGRSPQDGQGDSQGPEEDSAFQEQMDDQLNITV